MTHLLRAFATRQHLRHCWIVWISFCTTWGASPYDYPGRWSLVNERFILSSLDSIAMSVLGVSKMCIFRITTDQKTLENYTSDLCSILLCKYRLLFGRPDNNMPFRDRE